jgi:hypothetical protein
MPSTITNKCNCNLLLMPKTTNALLLHEFRINNKVLIRRDIGNPYLGKLAKPTQGPFKIIDVQQIPINGTILMQ